MTDGVFEQVIQEHPELPAGACLVTEAQVDEYIARESKYAFRLLEELPIRVTVLRIDGKRDLILIAIHHIATDGTTMSYLLEDLERIYQRQLCGQVGMERERVSYAQYAQIEREFLQSEHADSQLAYWKETLKGIPYGIHMPLARPRPEFVTYRGATMYVTLPDAVLAQLRTVEKRYGMTRFMVLESAFATALHLYSGDADICVGVPVQGRRLAEVKETAGFFANMIVLRSIFQSEQSVASFLETNKLRTLEAFRNQDYPFEKVVANLTIQRRPDYLPVFQYAFQYIQGGESRTHRFGDVAIHPKMLENRTAKFELTVTAIERDGALMLHVEYNTDLFDRALVQEFLAGYEQVLWQFAQSGNCLLDTVSLTGEQDVELVSREAQAERSLAAVGTDRAEANYFF